MPFRLPLSFLHLHARSSSATVSLLSFLSSRSAPLRNPRTRLSRLVDRNLPTSPIPLPSESPPHDACTGCEEPSRSTQCRPHPRARAKQTGVVRSALSSARSRGHGRKLSVTMMHIHLLSELPIFTISSSHGQRESSTSPPRSPPKSPQTSGN